MTASPLKKDDLIAYGSAAAGHEGILSDPTGTLVIKPCHGAEIAFYEDSFASHQDFAAFIPTYMGKLSLSSPDQREALQNQDPTSISAALQSDLSNIDPQSHPDGLGESVGGNGHGRHASAGQSDDTAGGLRKFGKKLESEMAIVLENVAAGFVRPCVLDVKLGERLWDDDAPLAKRARLDKVASETTSSTLGFRLAGMRIWQGNEVKKYSAGLHSTPQSTAGGISNGTKHHAEVEMQDGYAVYNKLYGRHATDVTVVDGFKAFLTQSPAGRQPEYADMVLRCCERDLRSVQNIMEAQESRMYSASILIVYEGDKEAMDKAVAVSLSHDYDPAPTKDDTNNDNNDDDDDSDSNSEPKVYALKLIDFAHAAWTPGQGPDENALRGIRNVRKILNELMETA